MNPLDWTTRQLVAVRAILTFAFALVFVAAFIAPAHAATASMLLTVDAANPHWDTGEALDPKKLKDLYVRLYGAKKGQPKTLLDAAPWAASLNFTRTSASADVHCYTASLALDTTGDAVPDTESDQTVEWCGTFASPPPVLHLGAPNGITGQSPSP